MATGFIPSDQVNSTRMNQLITELENLINGIKNGTTTISPDIGNLSTLLDAEFTGGYDVPLSAIDPTGASSGDVVKYNGTTVVWDTGGGGGSSYPLYVPLPWFFSWLPSGCLFLNGKSIGNAASGGTARADADVETLFGYFWDEMDAGNMDENIQDSSGSPSTLGASSAADFSAAKRIPLPDFRGRAPFGTDNMDGTSAGVVTDAEADKLGGVMGDETHTLTESEMPSHTHNTYGPPFSWNSGSGGNTSPRFTLSASSSAGGDSPHNNMPPALFVNFIIRYE